MPTKTDRILSYLPGTFRALPKPTALYSVADAFGNELLLAENSLAALMMSHWVDHADRGADLIQDLACIASLYGLAPRGSALKTGAVKQSSTCPPAPADESVEEFREHLKRHVRTFIEGAVTVQGILRVTAESLGLRIKDEYDELDTWWTRSDDAFVTVAPRGDDAATMLFGIAAADVSGAAARASQITGGADLPNPIELGADKVLRIAVDGAEAVDIELPASATLDQIVQTINTALAAANASHNQIAWHDGRRLTLTSPTRGANSRIDIPDGDNDAASMLLGLPPHVYRGTDASRAQVGSRESGGEIDLSQARYLRLAVDGKHLAEVDCAGADPARTKLAEIARAINDAFKTALGADLATQGGTRLTLTSPTTGSGGSVALQPAAAQDAREILFGPISTFHAGRDAQRARAAGSKDLSLGADLSKRSRLRIRFDAAASVVVDVIGADPARTTPSEIVAALNAKLGAGAATTDGRFITLVSQTAGALSALAFEPLPAEEDAAGIVFGIGARTFEGADAEDARIVGTPELKKVNLHAVYKLRIGLDGGEVKEVDVGALAANRGEAALAEISAAINDAFGISVASDDGKRLILGSQKTGAAGRIVIEPLHVTQRNRFVTRAFTSDEGAQLLFGFLQRQARGAPSLQARIAGAADLSRGVDLAGSRLLRIGVAGVTEEIDLAGPRPRVTTLDDILGKFNDTERDGRKFNGKLRLSASSEGGSRLALTAIDAGAGRQIAFEPPHGVLPLLFGHGPKSVRGAQAKGVTLVGTVDLSAGVELAGDGSIKIGIDGQPAVQIACAKPPTRKVTLNQIVIAINSELGPALGSNVASHDGKRVVLTSRPGANSQIRFETPAGPDSTPAIFGFKPPRIYLGAQATPAQIASLDLSSGLNLRGARTLRLAVNGEKPIDIDCAAGVAETLPNGEPNPERQTVKPDRIALNINNALKAAAAPASAKLDSGRLIIASNDTGATARLDLVVFPGDDAKEKLFGPKPEITPGSDPSPATIEGEADLLAPVNLTERRTIRLAVDGARPVEIEVAGSAPGTTTLGEVVAKINEVFPGLASATGDARLRLTSPTSGETSSLELLPTRWLELIEYPPRPASFPESAEPPMPAQHGKRWTLDNDGAAETPIVIDLHAPHGATGPSFVNRTTGLRIKLDVVLQPGDRAVIWREPDGEPRAAIRTKDGTTRDLPAEKIVATHPAVLILPEGRSDWIYLDCDGARFNHARFNHARFAGGVCIERGVFDISRFSMPAPTAVETVFASSQAAPDPPVEIRFRWMRHQPGALTVNLPADLPEKFGGRFNQARFGSSETLVENYLGVVTEPASDPDNLKPRINKDSKLVFAEVVPIVELGFEAVTLPIRRPSERKLQGGSAAEPARIYLKEEGVPGFIRLTARKPGAAIDESDPDWVRKAMLTGPQGNAVTVEARKAGPALFNVTIGYQGARFENARQLVLGPPARIEDLLRPGPAGILQAKAAGIRAEVTRDGAEPLG